MHKGFLVLAAGVIAANIGLAADPSLGTPTFIVEAPDPTVQTANTGTIPNWTGSFTFNGTTFNYTMVGTNPAGGASTTVPVQVIPLIFQFSDGTILDPTQNSCGDTAPALTRTLNSPIFNATDFAPGGTDVGNTQYVDAFQRANFWSTVSGIPGYHVLLGTPTVAAPVTINVGSFGGHTAQGPCSGSGNTNNGKIGEMRIGSFELQLKRLLKGMPGTTFPIFIFYNTFFTQGGCCILGFHGTVGQAPNQVTYAVAAFSDPGLFNVPIQDIHALSHEIGEWMDDPYTNNAVPGWTGGQIGSSCSKLLEVGDPVTGIAFTVDMNGFTYHPEDLVFLPWFKKAGSPTQSVNGWYTFLNSYAAPSPVC